MEVQGGRVGVPLYSLEEGFEVKSHKERISYRRYMSAGLDFYTRALLHWVLSSVRQCRRFRSKIRIFSTNKYGISITLHKHHYYKPIYPIRDFVLSSNNGAMLLLNGDV